MVSSSYSHNCSVFIRAEFSVDNGWSCHNPRMKISPAMEIVCRTLIFLRIHIDGTATREYSWNQQQ
jgi:hypothetical protein